MRQFSKTVLNFKPWSYPANVQEMDKKSFYMSVSVCVRFMFVSYPVNPLLVRQ